MTSDDSGQHDQDAEAGLDALLAQWEAERPAYEAWLAEQVVNAQRELDALLEAERPATEAWLAQLEAEQPQREAELAALLAEMAASSPSLDELLGAVSPDDLLALLEGAADNTSDDSGATRKR